MINISQLINIYTRYAIYRRERGIISLSSDMKTDTANTAIHSRVYIGSESQPDPVSCLVEHWTTRTHIITREN